MKWPWSKPKPLDIPLYQPPIRPVPPKDEPYVVEKVDMTATGIFKIFGRRPKE